MNTEQHISARRVGEVFLAFLRLGVTSFGGPIAHLGFFREDLVDKRKWVSEQQYAEFIAISQFLPGPASSQVGFAIGLSRAGYWGALSVRPKLRAAVNGANAAVVGILAAALVNPIITSTITGVVPLIIALVCLTMLAVLKWPSWSVVLVGASSGAVFAAFGLLG